MADVTFNSFNTRGLGDKMKRRLIFDWLQEHHKGITMLQETHSTVGEEKLWCSQWGSEILFSHGTSQKNGVAILFPSDLQCIIKHSVTDGEGRVLLTEVEIEEHEFILCNVYAPTKDKPGQQKIFLDKLKEMLTPYIDRDVIIGGDHNICQFPDLDKKGGKLEKQLPYAKEVISFKEEFELVDIWRLRHPMLRRFTRREKSIGGYVQSRLDYWLVSKHMEYTVVKTDILPGRRSDHSLISLKIELQNRNRRGKGFWKLNTSLLKDEPYLTQIRECIRQCKENYKDLEDKRLVWDVTKCEIRAKTISYACHKSKLNKQMEKELTDRISELEILLAEDPSDTLQAEYSCVTSELNSLLSIKTKGAMLRSKAKWVEDGEKNTSYFLKLEKRNQKLKCITKLCTDSGDIISEPEAILQEEKSFYQRLYSKADSICDQNLKDIESTFLENVNLNTLKEDEKEECESNVTLEECSIALKELPNGKSPGSDGLPVEFYKMVWPEIRSLLLECYLDSFTKGEMSIDQRRGIITLIPKQEKDLRSLNNWRPVSLLNADYKILAKIMANRLQSVMNNIVNTDQAGYIKNRYIGDTIRTIADIIDYCKIYKKPGIIGLIDFKKAFDSVSWSFLHKTLEAFNFGNVLQKWIKLLYKNISSCVTNNGHASEFSTVERGVRQGCPVSPLLFILVAETLSSKIRSDININGIVVKDTTFKISQLADDTTLFIRDRNSLKNAFDTLDDFAQVSGLFLNKKKTQVLCIGMDAPVLPNVGFKYIEGSFKTLGVWFSQDEDIMTELNFTACLENLKCMLNIWRQRDLSLKGKVTILKTLAISKLVYLSSLLFVPDWFITRVNKLFLDFMWDGKPSKVKLDTITGDIADGGLKMPHVDSVVKALKLSWLSRYVNNKFEGKWKVLSQQLLGPISEHLLAKTDLRYLTNTLTPFYSQLMGIWYKLYISEPKQAQDILQEKLFYNSFILVGKAPITKGYESWKQNNICLIQDLVNPQTGGFYTIAELAQKYMTDIDTMNYNSLITAVPLRWKSAIKHMELPIHVIHDEGETHGIPKLLFNGHLMPIVNLKNRDFYKIVTKLIFRPPTAISKWLFLYPELEHTDWGKVFTLPYKLSRSTKYQSFQYKILNRIFACRSNLATWKIVDSDLCEECLVVDSIEHYFFICKLSSNFWKPFQRWFSNATGVCINLDALTIVFGTRNMHNDNILFLMDYCILIGKWYIFKQKYLNRAPSFLEYLLVLKAELEVEKYLLQMENKIETFSKWTLLYDNL